MLARVLPADYYLKIEGNRMADPEPDQIAIFPQDGEVRYLFSKTLSKSDIWKGLWFVQGSKEYLLTLPVLKDINAPEIVQKATVYTPNSADEVIFKYNYKGFVLLKGGWDNCVRRNRFTQGEKIHCWSVYQAQEGTLSFLVQRAA